VQVVQFIRLVVLDGKAKHAHLVIARAGAAELLGDRVAHGEARLIRSPW
jgi:hypothetical protein